MSTTHERPTWATLFAEALDRERQAHDDRMAALNLRCPALESGGAARCTADATPEHVHRYRTEDLPSYDPNQH